MAAGFRVVSRSLRDGALGAGVSWHFNQASLPTKMLQTTGKRARLIRCE